MLFLSASNRKSIMHLLPCKQKSNQRKQLQALCCFQCYDVNLRFKKIHSSKPEVPRAWVGGSLFSLPKMCISILFPRHWKQRFAKHYIWSTCPPLTTPRGAIPAYLWRGSLQSRYYCTTKKPVQRSSWQSTHTCTQRERERDVLKPKPKTYANVTREETAAVANS